MAYPGSTPQWQQPPPGPQWSPPPVSPAAADGPYRWFKVYVAVMVVVYLLCFAGGTFVALAELADTPEEVTEQRITGAVYAVAGLIGLVVFGVGLFLPRRPWGWVYGVILIGLGLSSCCLMPATIPLLIFWLKPEMRARFNRT